MAARRNLRSVRIAVALALAAIGLSLAPIGGEPFTQVALAEPVADNDSLYAACGRVFPDPQAYAPSPTPAAGESPFAKGNASCRAQDFISYQGALRGLNYLSTKYPGFLEVIDLAETTEYDDVLNRELGDGFSAGLPNGTLARNRSHLHLFKVTNAASPIPEAARDHFVFPLSIHGIERAGIEGGLRAIEDLVTWGALEPDRMILETADAEVGGARNLPVGEVLQRSVSYFVLANPDGWRRGDSGEAGPFFMRYNGNGMDMNRDWPEIGYTERQYTPWSEPETRTFGKVLKDIKQKWTGGIDLHGQLTDRAFSFTLIGGSQRPFDKNERVQQFVEQAYADAEARLSWSEFIKPNNELPACVEPGLNGTVNPPPCDARNRYYGVQYGTIWDTIDYTVSGAFGNWIDSPIGLNADGIDNEMSVSHLINCGTGKCYLNQFEQLHVDGNKSLIYAMLNFSLQPPPAEFTFSGDAAYLVNPRRLVDAGSPSPTAPEGKVAQEALATTQNHGGGGSANSGGTTFEFDIADPASTEFYTGGVSGQVTYSNVQGVGGAAANGIAIDRQLEDGSWERVNRDFNQSPIYLQTGMKVDVNFPVPGHYRTRVFGPVPAQFRLDVFFTTAPAWPDPGQLPFDVSNMDFFTALQPFIAEGGSLTPVSVDDVLAGTRNLDNFDTVIAVDDAFLPGYEPTSATKESLPPTNRSRLDRDALAEAVRGFAERGGNVVLTDDSLRALEWMRLVPEASTEQIGVYAGHVAFTADDGETTTYEDPLAANILRPGAAEGTNHRRQITEPVPIGYRVEVNNEGLFQPEWFVDRAAWDAAGGRTVGTEGTDDSSQRVTFGEVPVGAGQVRILGSFTPVPSTEYDHPFGLSSYAITEPGYELARNMWSHENPAQVPPPPAPPDPGPGDPGPGDPGPGGPGGTPPPPPREPFTRLAGADRTETAAQISASTFAPGVPAVFVATGDTYPDALSGGPAAFSEGAPILLTGRDELPDVTRDEIQRLEPGRIVVLGGTAAVSVAVEAELDTLTDGGVDRFGGEDRFQTAAQVSAEHFSEGTGIAYVATGQNFPDTLSGGAAAARDGSPILLVTTDDVPDATVAELQRLKPGRIILLGGTAAVSEAVQAELESLTEGGVERVSGDDRYGTSAALSVARYGNGANTVYAATGRNFPDGLTGGPAAAAEGAPLLLVDADVPAPIATEMQRLDASRLVILGGTDAVSTAVEEELRGYLAE